MSTSAYIAACMVVGLAVAALWDIYLGDSHQETITDVMRQWSMRWPLLPFAIGAVAGHVFWCACPVVPK